MSIYEQTQTLPGRGNMKMMVKKNASGAPGPALSTFRDPHGWWWKWLLQERIQSGGVHSIFHSSVGPLSRQARPDGWSTSHFQNGIFINCSLGGIFERRKKNTTGV